MTAKQFLAEIVEPTIIDLENNPTSKRHAFLACVVTFHLIDYIAHPKKPALRRAEFRLASEAFAAVDRIAHAFKHVKTGDVRSKTILPLTAGQVIERPPAIWDTAVSDLSCWDDASGGVTIESEHHVDVLHAVKEAVKFLRTKA